MIDCHVNNITILNLPSGLLAPGSWTDWLTLQDQFKSLFFLTHLDHGWVFNKDVLLGTICSDVHLLPFPKRTILHCTHVDVCEYYAQLNSSANEKMKASPLQNTRQKREIVACNISPPASNHCVTLPHKIFVCTSNLDFFKCFIWPLVSGCWKRAFGGTSNPPLAALMSAPRLWTRACTWECIWEYKCAALYLWVPV